jgi:hypothetical protein
VQPSASPTLLSGPQIIFRLACHIWYEFRTDRSVWLYQDSQVYRVFNYILLDQDCFQLFDGMGRIGEVIYRIEGDQLFFFDPENPEEIVDQFSWAR